MKEKNQKRKFVRELIQALESLDIDKDGDGIGLMQDFEKPKRFIHFDPFGGENNELGEGLAE